MTGKLHVFWTAVQGEENASCIYGRGEGNFSWGIVISFGVIALLRTLLYTSNSGQVSLRRYFHAMGCFALGCLGQIVAGYQDFVVLTLVVGIVFLILARRNLPK